MSEAKLYKVKVICGRFLITDEGARGCGAVATITEKEYNNNIENVKLIEVL